MTEEVTGIDLVREQFRIANGESLDYGDPEPHAHSIEFRINGEDAGRGFLPAPGTVSRMVVPAGPGRALGRRHRRGRHRRRRVRLDDRQAHHHRPHPRAGHRALPPRPGRADHRGHADRRPVPPRGRGRPGLRAGRRRQPFTIHTRWIETEFDNTIEPYAGCVGRRGRGRGAPDRRRRGRWQAPRGLAARAASRSVAAAACRRGEEEGARSAPAAASPAAPRPATP